MKLLKSKNVAVSAAFVIMITLGHPAKAGLSWGNCGSSYLFVDRSIYTLGTAVIRYGFDLNKRVTSYSGSVGALAELRGSEFVYKNFYNQGTLFFRKSWDGVHYWGAGRGTYNAWTRW